MIRKHASVLALASTLLLGGCLDDWLTTEPQEILTDEQLWSDAGLVVSVLADFYDRIPQREGPHGGGQTGVWGAWTNFDEAVLTQQTPGAGGTYGYGSWSLYGGNSSWNLLRDIHVARQGIEGSNLSDEQKAEFIAELRFIRAYMYFEKVKRHGGIPLITDELLYDFSGDTEKLRVARASEAEIYDFIYSELEAIKDVLPANPARKARATRGAVLALQSRAMLYAASIAFHNYNSSLASPIEFSDPNTGKQLLGIPQDRADEYYTKSLNASRELLTAGGYSLVTGSDPAEAFHNIFVTKGHDEAILVRDFVQASAAIHWFGMRARPASMKVDQYINWAGSELSATLNVLENFDKLDGTSGPIEGVGDQTIAGQADWVYYDTLDGPFQGRDGRLKGTLLVPGEFLGNQQVELQAGVYVWDESNQQYDRSITPNAGSLFSDNLLWTGVDGPYDGTANKSATGIYMKKYLNPDPNTGRYSPGDTTWWIFFRLGEIYMNAAEAAFQLGEMGEALGYINTLRERAGFPANSLATLTMEKIQSERWAELAYEDHRLWDLKRWRIAHDVWDGVPSTESARIWVVFPYRIVRPGHPNHNKYVFDRKIANFNANPIHFRVGNYYSQLPGGAINNNPLLVQNPIQE